MKFLGRASGSLEFALGAREVEALRFVLGRYPALDPAYHQVARPGNDSALVEEQRLLVEAMAEAQRENQRRLREFLATRLRAADGAPEKTGLRLVVSPADADWLLEVLNDVRMGAWVKLGCPAPSRTAVPKSGAAALADFSAMELAGLVQTVLLEAMQS